MDLKERALKAHEDWGGKIEGRRAVRGQQQG